MCEPQKFFLGVIDFFAIILPGAILTFLIKDKLGPFLLSAKYSNSSALLKLADEKIPSLLNS
jgi:hypothetical protein